jgi:hypothetical protein
MAIFLSMSTTSMLEASSNDKVQKRIDFGQKVFRKKLQRRCGYTAGHWAQKHTQTEWIAIQKTGNFKAELITMCPKTENILKDKWMEPLYLFAKEYAQDTGKRPRC